MTDLDRLMISISYKNSDKRRMLLEVWPCGSNIAEVARANNCPEEILRGWYDLSLRVFGAYNLDAYRNPGFVLAEIV
jgi:hypothetical protein